MKKFGFSIAQGRSLNMDELKRDKVDLLLEKVPSYKLCIGCGACTAACSAGQFTDYNMRKVHISFMRGDTAGLETALQNCMLCGKCTLVCPRGVNTRALIVEMRRILHG